MTEDLEAKEESAPKPPIVTIEDVIAKIAHVEMVRFPHKSGQIIRWAVLTMTNGMVVTGEPSVMASEGLDNQAVAEQVAVSNAQDKAAPLVLFQVMEDFAKPNVVPCIELADTERTKH